MLLDGLIEWKGANLTREVLREYWGPVVKWAGGSLESAFNEEFNAAFGQLPHDKKPQVGKMLKRVLEIVDEMCKSDVHEAGRVASKQVAAGGTASPDAKELLAIAKAAREELRKLC